MSAADQLAALARLHELLMGAGVDYWVFGGWAVDFHAGAVTREHDDIDVAVWLEDRERVADLLVAGGWRHTPDGAEDGSTAFERGTVRVELAFLARDDAGTVYTPLRHGRAEWAGSPFEDDVAELDGTRARVISLASLKAEKAGAHDDPVAAAKDRADLAKLSALG